VRRYTLEPLGPRMVNMRVLVGEGSTVAPCRLIEPPPDLLPRFFCRPLQSDVLASNFPLLLFEEFYGAEFKQPHAVWGCCKHSPRRQVHNERQV